MAEAGWRWKLLLWLDVVSRAEWSKKYISLLQAEQCGKEWWKCQGCYIAVDEMMRDGYGDCPGALTR